MKNDLISKKAVEEIIMKYRDEQADKLDEIALERAYGANKVGMLISELPTVKPIKDEWIPTSEIMPGEEEEVLICTKDNEIVKAYHTLQEWSEDEYEWFVFGTLGYSLTFYDDEVVAWMPLPKPYKEREGKE